LAFGFDEREIEDRRESEDCDAYYDYGYTSSRKTTMIALFLTSCVYRQLQVKICHAYNLSRGLHFERCSYPFGRSLFEFYQGNFHDRKNKKLVPSLPKSEHVCNDDAVYVLRSRTKGILAALRLTRSKSDGKILLIIVHLVYVTASQLTALSYQCDSH